MKTKYNEYATYCYNGTNFNVEYRQFNRNFPEITDKAGNVKQETLQTFSKTAWSNPSFEDKCAHLLVNCDGCMKKINYRKVIAEFSI